MAAPVDSATTLGLGDYEAKFKGMSPEDFAAYKASREEEQKIGKEQQAQAGKAAEAKILGEYGSTMFSKPAPHFSPSQEDMSGFAALGSLLAVSGAMLGMKGKTSGIMAMNAVSGMMKGYQQGRKDLYEQERQKFEESMKEWERDRSQVKEAFDIALKMAPTNYKGAVDFLNKTLTSLGVSMPKALVEKNGLTSAAGTIAPALEKAGTTAQQIGDKTGFKMSPAERIAMAEETARREAQTKIDTGALEWVKLPDGTVDRMTAKEVERRRRDLKENIQYIPTPTSKTTEPELDVGPYAKTIIQNQSTETQAETQKFLSGKKTIDPNERKQLDNSKIMLDDSERVAKYIAENPDAAGMLGQALGKSEPVLGMFRTAPKSMDDLESRIDNGLDAIAKADPSQRATAQKAAVLNKMLAALSLKDAAATGRPTVFLERMISRWYNQGYPPDTLIDIIKERASEADGVLANYKLDTSRNRPEVNKQNYPLASESVDEYLKQFRKAPAAAGLTELSPAQKTGIQARIDQVNKDASLTEADKKDIKNKIKKQLEGKFSDSGLNWGD